MDGDTQTQRQTHTDTQTHRHTDTHIQWSKCCTDGVVMGPMRYDGDVTRITLMSVNMTVILTV